MVTALGAVYEVVRVLDTSKLEEKAKLLEQTVQDLLAKSSQETSAPPGMYQ